MPREELQRASDHLEAAAERTGDDDRRDRLEDVAEQLDRLADADHGPDHGRLARFENALLEVSDGADDAAEDSVVEAVTTAHEALKEYRSGVEGV